MGISSRASLLLSFDLGGENGRSDEGRAWLRQAAEALRERMRSALLIRDHFVDSIGIYVHQPLLRLLKLTHLLRRPTKFSLGVRKGWSSP